MRIGEWYCFGCFGKLNMKKSEPRTSLFSRAPVTKPAATTTQYSSGIVIKMYADYEESCRVVHVIEFGQKFTAEQLCYKAAIQLNFSPFTTPLLALCQTEPDLYFAPNQVFPCLPNIATEFMLRVRFIPPESVLSRLAGNTLHVTIFDYLYLQIRHDFINDRIDFHGKSIGQEHKLGLGVIDMVRYNRQHTDTDIKLEPLGFIPCSAREHFRFIWDRKRLQMNFKPHVEKESKRYKDDSVANIKLTYIKSILQYCENNYGLETFILPSTSSDKVDKVVVAVYDKMFPGIYVESREGKFHSTIADIMNISLSDGCAGMVSIHRRSGMPKTIDFADRQKAISFISLIDGYYRLQEDYHCHLCKDVESPMLNALRSLRCHGPVSKEWAEKRLIERHSRDASVNYMLRQSEKEFCGYTLVYLPHQQQKPIFLQIRQTEGQYQVFDKDGKEPLMSTISELVDYYKRNGSFRLNKCVYPANPLDSKIYLCRADNKSTEDMSVSSRQQEKTPVCLVSLVECSPLIDHGQFTEVWASTWDKKSDDSTISQKVAVKRLKQLNNISLQYFTQCIHHAVFWDHPTIVTVYAVCLSNPLSLILEYAEHRSLDVYLQHPKEKLSVYHLVLAAEQLAQAIYYLEQHNQVHGNIRCRNVLVFKHQQGSFTVKLADPGLIHYYNSLPVNHPINMDRLPWIAPECYSNLPLMSTESDLYSFGVCLWEIFSQGKRPYFTATTDELFHQLKRGQLDKLVQPESCPNDIYSIMTSCCDVVAESRMKSRLIIRNIRSLMASHDGSGNSHVYSDVHWLSNGKSKSDQTSLLSNSGAVNSSAAIADNEANVVRLLQSVRCNDNGFSSVGDQHANDEKCRLTDGNGIPGRQRQTLHSSASSSVCSSGAAVDSGTPLLSPGSSATEHRTSFASNVSATSANTSDCMALSDADNTGSTFIGGSPTSVSEFVSIQNRPLPEPPTVYNPSKYEINFYMLKYDQTKPLGQGHYGEVLKGTYTNESGIVTDVAIKRLKKSMTEKFQREFEKEFRIMIDLQHENIVRIIGRSDENDDPGESMLLVMEYVANGCLREYLKQNENNIPQLELIRFCRETAEGMVYLSDAKIVHRDLATRNILVTDDIHMKISDFGLSRALGQDRNYYKCTEGTDLPAPWCAPEALVQQKFSEQSDLWSYGITLWEIFSFGQPPKLCEINDLAKQMHDGRRLPRPKMCPQNLYQIVLFHCWQYFAKDRYTFRQLVNSLNDLYNPKPEAAVAT